MRTKARWVPLERKSYLEDLARPGQFAVLGLPGSAARTTISDPETKPSAPDKLIKRAYSIASSSKAKEFMEFYFSLVPSGELTPRLFKLRSGDRV